HRHARGADPGPGGAVRRHRGQIAGGRRGVSEGCSAPDAVLARRAADGDERAFAELVRRRKGPLQRLRRRCAGDPEDAYEAVQEAFIAAWSALRRYDANRPFLAWLRTIALNKARDRGRRAAVRRLVFGAGGLGERAAQGHADP